MSNPDIAQPYLDLREVARRQLDALAASDIEAFTALTAAREQAFAALQAREGELAGLSDVRSAEIRTLVNEILALDAEIQAAVAQAAAHTQEELGRVQQGLQALNSYASGSAPEAIFIDRNG